MRKMINKSFFEQVVDKMIKNKTVFGAVLCVENGDKTISRVGGAGNFKKDDRYFIASVTKMYVTAVILRLRAEKLLQLEDSIFKYLPENLLSGLHVLNGVDYTREITLAHLMSNTSGIPDYFSYKQADGKSAAAKLLEGNDDSWTLEKELETAKKLKPRFKPGQKGKVSYSDTNYGLLGGIIENITGKKIAHVFKEYIFDELNLENTYVYHDINDKTPVPMYYKLKQVHLPKYMVSIPAEGGIVSTAEETMIFLKAFINGRFFSKENLEELKKWNFVFFPGQFYYGMGLEKLWVPRVVSPFKPIREILGFWGQSGAFAFYNSQTDLYFSGTVNQLSGFGHGSALKAMIKIIKHCM